MTSLASIPAVIPARALLAWSVEAWAASTGGDRLELRVRGLDGGGDSVDAERGGLLGFLLRLAHRGFREVFRGGDRVAGGLGASGELVKG